MTSKVVFKTLNIFYTKRKIFRKKFELNFISSFIIFDFSDTLFIVQIKSKIIVFIIQILTFFKKGIV